MGQERPPGLGFLSAFSERWRARKEPLLPVVTCSLWDASNPPRRTKMRKSGERLTRGLKNSYRRTNRLIEPHIDYYYWVSMLRWLDP